MAMIQSFPTGSGNGTSKISQKLGNAATNITGSINPTEDGLYVEDLSTIVNNINYTQKIVNKPGREELISAPIVLPKFNKPATTGTSVMTQLGVTATLNNDINNYDYIDIYLQPSSAARKRIPQTIRLRVSDVVYNNTTSEDPVNGSMLLLCYDIDTTSGFGGQYHANIKAWFKDSTNLYLYQGSTPIADENWRDWVITNITGVITESTIVDPVAYLSKDGNLEETPVGSIISYMGNNVPKHYLACDGTVYNISDYPELALHIKNEFGSFNNFGGDGITTFAVPDLSGEFLRGTGANSHTNQGSGTNVGEHQDEGLPNITGSVTDIEANSADGAFSRSSVSNFYVGVGGGTSPFGVLNFSASKSNSIYGSSNHVTPTNTSVLYCIKYETTHKVFFGDQTTYKVSVPITYNFPQTAQMVWAEFDTANAEDDISMLGSSLITSQGDAFVAPMDGYYHATFMFPEQADISGTKVTYHSTYIYKNGDVVGGSDRQDNSTNIRVPLNESFTLKLKKGDTINVGVYMSGQTTAFTRNGIATFCLVNSLNENKVLELMNKPNLWVVGQEYDFGDGVYGQRFTGSVTHTAKHTAQDVVLTSTIPDLLISSGGKWNRGTTNWALSIGQVSPVSTSTSGDIDLSSAVVIDPKRGLSVRFYNNNAQTSTYDIWVKYTK